MKLPSEAYEIIIIVVVISIAMTLVSYLTKRSRNFSDSRNRRGRKQL